MKNQNLKLLFLLFLLVSATILFFAVPLPILSAVNHPFCRGFLFFLPLADPNLYIDQTGAAFLFTPDADRLKIIGIGLFELAIVLGIGHILLRLLCPIPERVSQNGLTAGERLFLSFLFGATAVSTYLFWFGYLGRISRTAAAPLVILGTASILHILLNTLKSLSSFQRFRVQLKPPRISAAHLLGLVLFVLTVIYLLAGAIPPFEYDTLEYHAQGAREIFESGTISFNEYNVYLNMPLGAEMFYLLGLLLNPFSGSESVDSLMLGVTGGKFFMSFVPLFCAAGAAFLCKRFISPSADSKTLFPIAAISVLSFPEVFQVSALGLIDLFPALTILGTVYIFRLTQDESLSNSAQNKLFFAAGLSLGFGAVCKYTMLPFALLPAIVVFFLLRPRRPGFLKLQNLSCFTVGTLISGTGWYLKNLLSTGNPFYPLAFSLFGDRTGTWDLAKNARWHTAHSAHAFGLSDFFTDLARCFTDDFSSLILPIFTVFLLVYLIRTIRHPKKSPLLCILGYLLFFYIFWWFFTHRLLRFLVPVLPLVGTASVLLWHTVWHATKSEWTKSLFLLPWFIAPIYAASLFLVTTPGLFSPIRMLTSDPSRYGEAPILLNREPAADTALLLIGDSRAFAFRARPILYNTCWDNACLRTLLIPKKEGASPWQWTKEDIEQIKTNFQKSKIGTVLIDTGEINRFLSPGNYGLTDREYADPALFDALTKAGILEQTPSPDSDPNLKLYRVKPAPR